MFVNQTLDEIAALAETVPLAMVQLHGEEGPSFCAEVARRTGARVIKAARIRSGADLQALQAFRNVDYHLVDAHVEGLRGGTGQTVDWELIAGRHSDVPLILSGGLTPRERRRRRRARRPVRRRRRVGHRVGSRRQGPRHAWSPSAMPWRPRRSRPRRRRGR